MKTTLLAGLATAVHAASVLAQGLIYLDDPSPASSLAVNAPSNWYSGTFGMEVWELNATTIPPGINVAAAPGSGLRGHEALAPSGFTKEATFPGQSTLSPGYFDLGTLDMLDVRPLGATVVLALAAWNTGDASWSAMLANPNAATRCGVVAFVQPTADPTIGGILPARLALDQDLIMCAIPEPPGLALAGLGGVLLLLCRRRGGLTEPGRAGPQTPAPWRCPLPLGGQHLGRC